MVGQAKVLEKARRGFGKPSQHVYGDQYGNEETKYVSDEKGEYMCWSITVSLSAFWYKFQNRHDVDSLRQLLSYLSAYS